ncbi:hypothetical protein AB0C81_04530 [Streptomyces roseoverticillatus]|uniref:hypothetical protein n=1 Tax=Streptomyces roseoverticillatus TaxID=66429 RepID=UPI0033D4A41C
MSNLAATARKFFLGPLEWRSVRTAIRYLPDTQRGGANRARQDAYAATLTAHTRNPLFAAGRLATYNCINMDQAVRQSLEAAHRTPGPPGEPTVRSAAPSLSPWRRRRLHPGTGNARPPLPA